MTLILKLVSLSKHSKVLARTNRHTDNTKTLPGSNKMALEDVSEINVHAIELKTFE